jgi:hypothetical protein
MLLKRSQLFRGQNIRWLLVRVAPEGMKMVPLVEIQPLMGAMLSLKGGLEVKMPLPKTVMGLVVVVPTAVAKVMSFMLAEVVRVEFSTSMVALAVVVLGVVTGVVTGVAEMPADRQQVRAQTLVAEMVVLGKQRKARTVLLAQSQAVEAVAGELTKMTIRSVVMAEMAG